MKLLTEELWIRDDYTDNLECRNKRYMNMVKCIGQFGLLIESVSETIENEAKKTQKADFLTSY